MCVGKGMKCRFKIGFFAIVLFFTVAFTSAEYFVGLLFSVAIHESGHIIAAKIRRIKLSEMRLDIFGALLYTQNQLFSYIDEIILCIGGPVANFISVGACWFMGDMKSTFFFSSVALGMLNCLPVYGFDGGRILSSFLSMLLEEKIAVRICKAISFVVLMFIWWISVYFLLRIGATLNLFVFSMIMFVKIFIQK